MKHLLLAALVMILSGTSAFGDVDPREIQAGTIGPESTDKLRGTYRGYVEQLKKADSQRFSEDDINRIFRDYSRLIMSETDTQHLINSLEGNRKGYFALEELKNESFYPDLMRTFIHSKNPNQRVLAYITLASAGDSSFNHLLLKAARSEKGKGGKLWSGYALLYLHDPHTSELFDFLVENETLGDCHMFPLYLELDKASIQRTAYENIKSKNDKAKILAVQSLSVTKLNSETESVVRHAVKTWNSSIRGYAIYTLKSLAIGDLKSLLTPSLKDQSLRRVSLEALADSPTRADQEFLGSFVPENSEVPEEVLDAYLKSSRVQAVREWLTLVRDNPVPSDYIFFCLDQPLLKSNELLSSVRDTIRQTKNRRVIHELVRVLADRRDEESTNLLIQLLSDGDSDTRYWAGESLKRNGSPQLVSALPTLIRNPSLRTVALTDLAIENEVDGLHAVFEELVATTEWRRSSLAYLSAFPRSTDAAHFKSVLTSSKDVFEKRLAVRGLGELRDSNSVGLIETALREEPSSALNAITYIEALGKIKGSKAKAIIESFKASENATVHELVSRILSSW